MKARKGQIAILLAAALLAVIVLAVMNVSVFLAVRSKNRAMNAGDAAAIAVAKYQGELLNRIGQLNVDHLRAAIARDLDECARITLLQRRICFLDPMKGLSIGNAAARANGVERSPCDSVLRILREHVVDIRRVFATDPDLYPPPWEGAWEEYATQLETMVGELGEGFVAGPDNIEFVDAWECFPLLSKQFYNAIAGRSWCWFHFNGEWLLDRDSHNMPRPDFSVRHSCDNCEIYPLHLEFRPMYGLDEEMREVIMRLVGCTPAEIEKADLYVSNNQIQNFCECLDSRKMTISPAEVGGRSCTLCLLCNMSYVYDTGFDWDPKRMQLAQGETKGISTKREVYRNGWEIVV